MSNFTTFTNEMKREIVKFTDYLTKNVKSKVNYKFIGDAIYGIAASQSLLISNIARELNEPIKLDNTIERLCIRLDDDIKELPIIKDNYYGYVRSMIPNKPQVIFDNSDIVKIYGKKFEDLDLVHDGSDDGKLKPGYTVVNAVVLGKNKKQPIPIYSKIISTKSKDFVSMNRCTYDCIDEIVSAIGANFFGVFDRGYDDKKTFRYLDKRGIDFLIRLKGNRNMLFKGKSKNVLNQAKKAKGKIVFNAKFKDADVELKISYTRANLTDENKEEYTLVYVYGFNEEEPMILITNTKVNNAHDARVLVRAYLDRWRIEEVHRAEKQNYDYEDMRLRKLKRLNNLNTLFMMYLGFMVKLIETMDERLLSIKIMESSKSLVQEMTVYIGMYAKGISKILKLARVGVQKYREKNKRKIIFYEQLALQL